MTVAKKMVLSHSHGGVPQSAMEVKQEDSAYSSSNSHQIYKSLLTSEIIIQSVPKQQRETNVCGKRSGKDTEDSVVHHCKSRKSCGRSRHKTSHNSQVADNHSSDRLLQEAKQISSRVPKSLQEHESLVSYMLRCSPDSSLNSREGSIHNHMHTKNSTILGNYASHSSLHPYVHNNQQYSLNAYHMAYAKYYADMLGPMTERQHILGTDGSPQPLDLSIASQPLDLRVRKRTLSESSVMGTDKCILKYKRQRQVKKPNKDNHVISHTKISPDLGSHGMKSNVTSEKATSRAKYQIHPSPVIKNEKPDLTASSVGDQSDEPVTPQQKSGSATSHSRWKACPLEEMYGPNTSETHTGGLRDLLAAVERPSGVTETKSKHVHDEVDDSSQMPRNIQEHELHHNNEDASDIVVTMGPKSMKREDNLLSTTRRKRGRSDTLYAGGCFMEVIDNTPDKPHVVKGQVSPISTLEDVQNKSGKCCAEVHGIPQSVSPKCSAVAEKSDSIKFGGCLLEVINSKREKPMLAKTNVTANATVDALEPQLSCGKGEELEKTSLSVSESTKEVVLGHANSPPPKDNDVEAQVGDTPIVQMAFSSGMDSAESPIDLLHRQVRSLGDMHANTPPPQDMAAKGCGEVVVSQKYRYIESKDMKIAIDLQSPVGDCASSPVIYVVNKPKLKPSGGGLKMTKYTSLLNKC